MAEPLFAILATERLTLRPVADADPDEVASALNDWAVAQWLGRVPFPYSRADAIEFAARHADRPVPAWFVHDAAGIVGGISLDDHLGFWIARKAWGRGYATEAARAVLASHFVDPEACEVESSHFVGNAASARVLHKLGFRDAGTRSIASRSQGKDMPGRRMLLDWGAFASHCGFTLEADRLLMLPLSLADVPDRARIGGHPDVAPMVDWATVPWPENEVRRFVARHIWTGAPAFRLAICLVDGTLIGTVGANAARDVHYFVDPDHWGRGYVTEALAAFLPSLFDRFGHADLGAEVYDDNPASARVLQKFGFLRTGEGRSCSAARLEPAPVSRYRLSRDSFTGRP